VESRPTRSAVSRHHEINGAPVVFTYFIHRACRHEADDAATSGGHSGWAPTFSPGVTLPAAVNSRGPELKLIAPMHSSIDVMISIVDCRVVSALSRRFWPINGRTNRIGLSAGARHVVDVAGGDADVLTGPSPRRLVMCTDSASV